MNEYHHLRTETAKLRYGMAVHALREKGCDRVIEIGGARSPIDSFLWSTDHILVSVIDPAFEKKHHVPTVWAEHIGESFADVSFDKLLGKSKSAALVILGIELDCEYSDLIELCYQFPKFDRIILDWVSRDNKLAGVQAAQFQQALFRVLSYNLVSELDFTFSWDHEYVGDIKDLSSVRRISKEDSFYKSRKFCIIDRPKS